jgi:hypothetical protein
MFNIKKLRIPLPKKPERVHKADKDYDRRRFKEAFRAGMVDISDINDAKSEMKNGNNEESPDDSEISA